MNRWTQLSLTCNALLLAFTVWLGSVDPGSRAFTEASRFLASQGLRAKPQPLPVVASLPEVVEVNKPLCWAQVESADYRIYVANLRGIGCPEPTVRDVIIADVNDLFAPRVKAVVDEVSGRFWELIIRQDDFEKMVEEKHTQLRALRGERDEIFTALFGDNDPRSAEALERDKVDRRKQWEGIADFLSEEKREWFVAAGENRERAWSDFLRTASLTDAQQQAKRQELEAAYDQSLREEFTPDEYHELRLRQSPAASLRDRLVGLDLNEETVRALANIRFTKEEAQAALAPMDGDFKSRKPQLRQQSEARTRELVGVSEYAALQRATDSRYEPIYRVTQRLKLPDSTAAQVYDLRRQAEDAANRVQADKSLAAEERQALMHSIGAETKQSLSTTLGLKGFAAYERIDGGWIQQLTSVKR